MAFSRHISIKYVMSAKEMTFSNSQKLYCIISGLTEPFYLLQLFVVEHRHKLKIAVQIYIIILNYHRMLNTCNLSTTLSICRTVKVQIHTAQTLSGPHYPSFKLVKMISKASWIFFHWQFFLACFFFIFCFSLKS